MANLKGLVSVVSQLREQRTNLVNDLKHVDAALSALSRLNGGTNHNGEPASFVLFVAGKPAMKLVAQDGKPLPAEHLISSVNLRVEVEGTEFGDTFRLVAMRKLESPPIA